MGRSDQSGRSGQETGVNGEEAARLARYRQSTDIRRIACDVFGATVVEVSAGPGVLAARQLDDPLAGVRAAAFVQSVGRAELYNHTVQARAAGRSWHDIAAALGLGEDHGDPAQMAFEVVVEGQAVQRQRPIWRPTARWTCAGCRGRVVDSGPYEAYVSDNESGHTKDCDRLHRGRQS
jgi:hypothetical protein